MIERLHGCYGSAATQAYLFSREREGFLAFSGHLDDSPAIWQKGRPGEKSGSGVQSRPAFSRTSTAPWRGISLFG
jgi:hypothetical protein